jgi:hypothetical protein
MESQSFKKRLLSRSKKQKHVLMHSEITSRVSFGLY